MKRYNIEGERLKNYSSLSLRCAFVLYCCETTRLFSAPLSRFFILLLLLCQLDSHSYRYYTIVIIVMIIRNRTRSDRRGDFGTAHCATNILHTRPVVVWHFYYCNFIRRCTSALMNAIKMPRRGGNRIIIIIVCVRLCNNIILFNTHPLGVQYVRCVQFYLFISNSFPRHGAKTQGGARRTPSRPLKKKKKNHLYPLFGQVPFKTSRRRRRFEYKPCNGPAAR